MKLVKVDTNEYSKNLSLFSELYRNYQEERTSLPFFPKDYISEAIINEIKPHLNRKRYIVYSGSQSIGLVVLDLINPVPSHYIAKLECWIIPENRDTAVGKMILKQLLGKIPNHYDVLRFSISRNSVLYSLKDELKFKMIAETDLKGIVLDKHMTKIQNMLDHNRKNNDFTFEVILNGDTTHINADYPRQYLFLKQNRFSVDVKEIESENHEELLTRWNKKRYEKQPEDEEELILLTISNNTVVGSCTINLNCRNEYVAYIEDLGLSIDFDKVENKVVLLAKTIVEMKKYWDINYVIYEDEDLDLISEIEDNLGFEVLQRFYSFKWSKDNWI